MENCRICAGSTSNHLVRNIFEGSEPIADMIFELCGLEISENDGLPDIACCGCCKNLEAALRVRRKCLASDDTLKELLLKTEEVIVEECEKETDAPVISYKIIYEEVIETLVPESEPTCTILVTAPELEHSREQATNEVSAPKPDDNTEADEQQSERVLRCCGCESTFDSKELLLQHCKTIHEPHRSSSSEKAFECGICFKRYTSERGLRLHRKNVYQIKHHQCAQCGKRFGNRTVLENHERSHTKQKPFSCVYCTKTFGSKSNLLSHLKLHSEDAGYKKHVCSLCHKEFSRKSYLKHHYSLLHSEDTPFACSFCPSRFKAKANLRLHLRTHTRERPYACDQCDKSFMYPTDKKRHMIQHTGQKPFKCPHCDKAFTRQGLLRKHRACHEEEAAGMSNA